MESIKKSIIVTGAYGGIGKEISRQLAAMGHMVCMVGRDEKKLRQAQEELIRSTSNDDITIAAIDLSLKKEILDFTENWQKPLHVLINNAATTPKQREESAEGLEMQFAVNILGYFLLTKYLTCIMNTSAPARVVNVASYYAGGLDLHDLEFKKRKYDSDAAYRQSKQANRMLTVAFAERLKPLRITVNSCHPGDVSTKLSNSMGFAGPTSAEEGAATPVFLAVDPSIEQVTGKFYSRKRQDNDEFASNKLEIDQLYDICEKYD